MRIRSTMAVIGAVIGFANIGFAAPTISSVYSFNPATDSSTNPNSALVADGAGSFYGTTAPTASSKATIYKFSPATHSITTLLSIPSSDTSLSRINGNMILGSNGNLYGTTDRAVVEFNPSTLQLTTLATATGLGSPGIMSGLVRDSAGNFYGVSNVGGANGVGSVFKVDATTHQYSVLHSFVDNSNTGIYPEGALTIDSMGNLYGATNYTNGVNHGGVLFKLSSDGQSFNILYTFSDPANPRGDLTMDSNGNIYGTTVVYGSGSSPGEVFKYDLNSQQLSLIGGGYSLRDGVILDADGKFFGVAFGGGLNNVGEIISNLPSISSAQLSMKSINAFSPLGGLTADANGNLYGTASGGGNYNGGVIYEITNSGFAVPEPASMSVIGLVSFLTLGRNRKFKSR